MSDKTFPKIFGFFKSEGDIFRCLEKDGMVSAEIWDTNERAFKPAPSLTADATWGMEIDPTDLPPEIAGAPFLSK